MSGGGRVCDGGLLINGCHEFSQNSVEVSCDLSLARLRLRSGGGGWTFCEFYLYTELAFERTVV